VPTVLVVDDSEIDRRLAGGLLAKQGGRDIVYASDGKSALAQFEAGAPDLVVTDLQMPEMNGLELVTAIKVDYPFTPVILMTAQGSEDIAAEALRRGAASYVPKKKLNEDLVDTVDRVLAAAREDRTHSHLMHHLAECEAAFELAPDLHLIRSLVAYLQQNLRCLPLGDEAERLRVGIALEEALKNAYYHGTLEVSTGAGWPQRKAIEEITRQRLLEEPYCRRRIYVRSHISRTEATFVIRDEGPGFDTSQLPDAADLSAHDSAIGRGIVLMQSIMDEVRFNADGNELTLVKRPPRLDEVFAEED
jgi:CheY-like chemotaxis protein/anti-sigma regulatory factor (Ser/Thr protein kinase)